MSDIQALQASIGADVALFLAAMKQASSGINELVQGQKAAQSAAKDLADQTGFAVLKWQTLANVAREAAHGVVELGRAALELGEASIEQATFFDPSAAIAYSEATDHLTNAVGLLEDKLGHALLPTLIKVETKLGDFVAKLANTDWSHAQKGFQNIGDAMDTSFHRGFGVFTNQIDLSLNSLAKFGASVADLITSPFRNAIASVLEGFSGLMLGISKSIDEFGKTTAGKKILDAAGLSGASGEFAKWSAGLLATSVAVQAGFTHAADSVKVAAQALNDASKGEFGKLAASFNSASKNSGPNRNQQEIAAQAQLEQMKTTEQKFRDQMATQDLQQRIALQRQEAQAQKADLLGAAQEAQQRFQQALQQLQQDRSSGNVSAIAADQKAVADAAKEVKDAYAKAQGSAAKALSDEMALAEQMKKRAQEQAKAFEDASKKLNGLLALAAAGDKSPKLAADIQAASKTMQEDAALMTQSHAQLLTATAATEALKRQNTIENNRSTIETAKEAADIQREAAKASATFYENTFKGLAKAGLGSLGSGIMEGGMQGFAAGGVAGAVAGAGAALIQNSAGFKAMGEAISGVLQQVADAMGRLFEPLVPLIKQVGQALGPLIKALGDIFGAEGRNLVAILQPLVPVLSMLANLLAQILEPVSRLLDAIRPLLPILTMLNEIVLAVQMIGFAPLVIALKVLGPAIDGVAKVVAWVADGLATVWNGMIHVLEKVFDALAHALPGGAGDAMRDVYNGLVGMEIPIDALSASTSDAATAVQNFAVVMSSATKQAAAAYTADLNKEDALKAAIQYAKDHGASQSVIDNLQKQYDATYKQADVDYYKALAEGAKDQGNSADYLKYMGEALALEAENTAATKDLTKATRDATAALANAPSGFRLALYEGAAAGSTPGLPAPQLPGKVPGLSSSGQTFSNCTFVVQTNDPDKMGEAIDKAIRTRNFRSAGTLTPASSGGFGG